MKKILLLFGILIFSIQLTFSQENNPVLLTINGEKITKSDFLAVYKKNNNKSESIDPKAIEEYLELFINFKLKVNEAVELGYDTIKTFVDELIGYRKQLTQPYLTDRDANELLLKEAYERMQWDLRASHLLIKIPTNATPKDTLEAFNKIMSIRKRILKGESFEKLAEEFSDDPSARDTPASKDRPMMKGNKGDLGFFTVLDMVYPFETAAYNTKVGEISMPVRTSFGYHLIKVVDRRKAMGKALVSHILILTPKDSLNYDDSKEKKKIDEIYERILKGEKFEEMAKLYSDDKATAVKNGMLPWFGVNRMVPEFISTISDLKNKNDISKPFKTVYGWHLVKIIDRKEIGTYDEVKTDLKNRITRDTRSQKSKESFIAKVKKENNFVETANSRKEFYKVVTDSIFFNKWDAKLAENLAKPLFTIDGKVYTQKDFTQYLVKTQGIKAKESIDAYVNKQFDAFVEEICFKLEDSKLETKYPEFKLLMQEYHDGILLFNITDQKVWSKAVKDTVGLKDFYEKNKTNYMWGERVDATIYICANDKAASDTKKMLKNATKKGYKDQDILDAINKDNSTNLKIEKNIFNKGDNSYIDQIDKKEGLSVDIKNDKAVVFVNINKIIAPQPKTINEIRGIITHDYQTTLEKEWIASLKSKYKVDVDKEVLKNIGK